MKLAVVSGGSRGLGAELCRKYLDLGYHTLEFSRSAPHAYSVRADFSDPPEAARVVAGELSRLAGIELEEVVVLSNAGTVQPIGPAPRKEPSEVIDSVNVNLTSAMLFICEAVRRFQDHPCRKTVVQITSGAALRAYFGWSLYCSAKAGMETFIRALALEQGTQPHPFMALSVEPGIIDTEMQAVIRAASEEDFPDRRHFLQFQRTGSLRPAREVAELVERIVRQNSGTGLRLSVYDFPS